MPWIRLPYAILQWLLFAVIKLSLAILGLVTVFLSLVADGKRRTPKCWQWWANVEETPKNIPRDRWSLYKEFAFRNPVHGMRYWFEEPEFFKEYGTTELDLEPGFQWRYRHTKFMDSFRITWGEPDAEDGKPEFYIGFKLGSPQPGVKFTVQLRGLRR